MCYHHTAINHTHVSMRIFVRVTMRECEYNTRVFTVYVYILPNFPAILKTHFSLPSVSYINVPTAHLFNTAKAWTVYFHSGLFLKPVWYPQVLGWPLNGSIFPWQADSQLWITTQLADKFGHWFNYFVWHVEVNMPPIAVIWLFLVKM